MDIGGNGRRMMKGSRNGERKKERERVNNEESDREKAERKEREQRSGEDLSIYNTQAQQQNSQKTKTRI